MRRAASGFDPAEPVGQPLQALYPEALAAAEGAGVHLAALRFGDFHVQLALASLRDEHGRLAGVVANWTDRTTEVRVETEVNALVQSRQWKPAQDLAEARLRTVPTDPQMRLLLSHIQTGQGQTQAAIDTLRALTLSFPELPEPHNNLAALLARDNRLEEALGSLQSAIRARPDYPLALENMGDLYLTLAARA